MRKIKPDQIKIGNNYRYSPRSRQCYDVRVIGKLPGIKILNIKITPDKVLCVWRTKYALMGGFLRESDLYKIPKNVHNKTNQHIQDKEDRGPNTNNQKK